MKRIAGTTIIGSEGKRVIVAAPSCMVEDATAYYHGTVVEVVDSDFFTIRWDGQAEAEDEPYCPVGSENQQWYWDEV